VFEAAYLTSVRRRHFIVKCSGLYYCNVTGADLSVSGVTRVDVCGSEYVFNKLRSYFFWALWYYVNRFAQFNSILICSIIHALIRSIIFK